MTNTSVARLRTSRVRSARGAVSAEYAVATAAGCGFASVLIKLLTSDWGKALLKALFNIVLSVLGISL